MSVRFTLGKFASYTSRKRDRVAVCRRVRPGVRALVGAAVLTLAAGCGSGVNENNPLTFTGNYIDAGEQQLTGDIAPIRDPSIIYANGRYIVFSTDPKNDPWPGHLPYFCSPDRLKWTYCGSVFTQPPSWIEPKLGNGYRFWGPDVSFFGGLYYVYYSVTIPGTQTSAIGFATTPTLDPADPAFQWKDHGSAILSSSASTNFNAIDPDIIQEPNNGPVHLTYGSFWTGIKQVQIDPATGRRIAGTTVNLAARPGVTSHAIEGASMVRHGIYYYLFVSIDLCCNMSANLDNYKIAVGRSTSPEGPFVDRGGTPMLAGGSTVILTGDGVNWAGVGGEQLYYDPNAGEHIMVYQALDLHRGNTPTLRVRPIEWSDDFWPVVKP